MTGQPDADPGGTKTSAAGSSTAPGGTRRAAARPRLRLRWSLLLALAGGLLLALAFAPFSLWPFAVIGPAALVPALYGRSLQEGIEP